MNMKRSATPLIISLSLAASVYLIVRQLPQVLPQESQQAATPTNTGVSADLIAYVREQHPVDRPVSDTLNNDQLIEQFEDLQDDYARNRSGNPLKDAMNENLIGMNYDPDSLQVPEGLEEIVDFWVNVFGVYDKDDLIFYNADDVGIVYSVLDFGDLSDSTENDSDVIKNQMVREESARLTRVLTALATKLKDPQAQLNAEETRIARLVAANPSINIDELGNPDNILVRTGYAHRFREAIIASGQYLPQMEQIFSEHGLPKELTCIPFVESSFNTRAFSSAAAAGIWQFIESTGRNYLNIDEYVDERYDPILSTYAAAAHLAREFKMLKSWPLTINAYNTGPGRILDAVNELKTQDIATIIKRYKGNGYGFDSRNYVPEVLAAIEVYGNRQRYFGDLTPVSASSFDYVEMPANTNLRELFEVAGVDAERMQKLNQAIKPDILNGDRDLPKGYRLRVLPQDKDTITVAARDLHDAGRLEALDKSLPNMPSQSMTAPVVQQSQPNSLPNSALPTMPPVQTNAGLAEDPIF